MQAIEIVVIVIAIGIVSCPILLKIFRKKENCASKCACCKCPCKKKESSRN